MGYVTKKKRTRRRGVAGSGRFRTRLGASREPVLSSLATLCDMLRAVAPCPEALLIRARSDDMSHLIFSCSVTRIPSEKLVRRVDRFTENSVPYQVHCVHPGRRLQDAFILTSEVTDDFAHPKYMDHVVVNAGGVRKVLLRWPGRGLLALHLGHYSRTTRCA